MTWNNGECVYAWLADDTNFKAATKMDQLVNSRGSNEVSWEPRDHLRMRKGTHQLCKQIRQFIGERNDNGVMIKTSERVSPAACTI